MEADQLSSNILAAQAIINFPQFVNANSRPQYIFSRAFPCHLTGDNTPGKNTPVKVETVSLGLPATSIRTGTIESGNRVFILFIKDLHVVVNLNATHCARIIRAILHSIVRRGAQCVEICFVLEDSK